MKIENCFLDNDIVLTPPLIVSRPSKDWEDARETSIIPSSLFGLYVKADCLSYGKAPNFLGDPNNILFSYFGMLLRSLKDLFVEGKDCIANFEQALDAGYNPIKKMKGEKWDPEADKRARKNLRDFVIAAVAILDNLADLIALFFTKQIPNLMVGRTQFTQIQKWLSKPITGSSFLSTPQEYFLSELHKNVVALVFPVGTDKDWLSLLKLLRNKSAHMGHRMFYYTCLMGKDDEDPRFYTFLPRRWPITIEENLSQGNSAMPTISAKTQIEQDFMHQDAISFIKGVFLRITTIVDNSCKVFADAYVQLKTFPVNADALGELNKNRENYAFEFFPETEK